MNPDEDHDDASLLIDFLLKECDKEGARQISRRLGQDAEFRGLHQSLQATFAAMNLLPQAEPPDDLLATTLSRIRTAQKTNALLAREDASRGWATSTFSIRELMGIAASILLLAAIFFPTIRQARQRVLESQCASNLGQVGMALSTYAEDNHQFLPLAADHPFAWLPIEGQTPISNSSALFKLIKGGRAAPSVFQCPAVASGETFAVQDGQTDFPSAPYISYSYQHPLGPQGAMRRGQLPPDEESSMAIMADANPVFKDGVFHPDHMNAQVSDNHASGIQNVLYLGLNVNTCSNPDVGVRGDNIFLVGKRLSTYRGDETPQSATDSILLPAYTPSHP